MAVSIDVDIPAKLILQALPSQIEEAAEYGLDEVADLGERAKGRNVNRTYVRGIPKGKNGRPRWKRSSDWKRGQRVLKAKGRRSLVDTGRPAKPIKGYPGGYAEKLGTLKTVRKNAAAVDTAEIVAPQAPKVMEQAIKNRIRLS